MKDNAGKGPILYNIFLPYPRKKENFKCNKENM